MLRESTLHVVNETVPPNKPGSFALDAREPSVFIFDHEI
jgi:hypothetical protein